MRRTADECRRERIALFVRVVREHVAIQRSRFENGEGVVVRDRRIVDRRDVDRHRGDVRQRRAVARAIGERVVARVGAVVRVGERAVCVERER